MCIINCSGACQVAILTHIHDDGYIPCTHATSQYSQPTALCACTRHSNCTYECISKQLSLPRLPSASRRPPVGLRQPPISLPSASRCTSVHARPPYPLQTSPEKTATYVFYLRSHADRTCLSVALRDDAKRLLNNISRLPPR